MIVYTAICGKYPITRADILCLGDDGIFQRPVMEAKRYKILSHLFLDEPTIWVDGNVWLAREAQVVAEELLGDADMALFAHPFRATVWQEFDALREQRRFRMPWLQQQLTAQEAAYRAAGLPADAPLYECSVLVRRNNQRVQRVMEAWWAQICRWQWRDQVSLPYVLWRDGRELSIQVHAIDVRAHPLFKHASQY